MNPGLMAHENLTEVAVTDLDAGLNASEGAEKLAVVTGLGDKLDEASSIMDTVDTTIATFQDAIQSNVKLDERTLEVTRAVMEHFYQRLATPATQRVASLENFSLPPYANPHVQALEEFRTKLASAYTVAEEAYGVEVMSIVDFHESMLEANQVALDHVHKTFRQKGPSGKPVVHTSFMRSLGKFRGNIDTKTVLGALKQIHGDLRSLKLPELLADMTKTLENVEVTIKTKQSEVKAGNLKSKIETFDKDFNKFERAYLNKPALDQRPEAIECLTTSTETELMKAAEAFVDEHKKIVQGLTKFTTAAETLGHLIDPEGKGSQWRYLYTSITACLYLAGAFTGTGSIFLAGLMAYIGGVLVDKNRNKILDGESKQDRAVGRQGRSFIHHVAEILQYCEKVGGVVGDYIEHSTLD